MPREALQLLRVAGRTRRGQGQGPLLSTVRPEAVVYAPGTETRTIQEWRTVDLPVSDLRVSGE